MKCHVVIRGADFMGEMRESMPNRLMGWMQAPAAAAGARCSTAMR
ncbi:MAG TPA: hypothetical protein VK437_02870 [Steroidobacteraceae bacterium]|nr:hypothetical protein [Steroidobacteraceae bacterium]